MGNNFYLTAVVFIIIVVLAVLALVINKRKKIKVDYYSLFLMGTVWIVMGLIFWHTALFVIGLIFALAGLSRRKDWKKNRFDWDEFTAEEKRLKFLLIMVLLLIMLLGFVIYAVGLMKII